MLDLVVRGGQVVAPWGVGRYDVAVKGGTIAALAQPGTLTRDIGRVIDASGKLVIPGGVEPHAHAAFRFVYPWARQAGHRAAGPDVISRACAFGGTTTIIDFANWKPGGTLGQAIESRDALYRGSSHVDYTFHCVLVGMGTEGATPERGVEIPLHLIDEIGSLIRGGFNSVKVWTTNTTATRPRQMTDMGHVWAIMQQVAAAGGVLAVHAEDDDILMYMSRTLHAAGRTGTEFLHEAHPNVSEDVSFRRVIRLAEWTGAAVYMMHVSAREGVRAVAEARARGQAVFAETLHHYAGFTSEVYGQPNGPLYHTYPSLKTRDDAESLWRGLVDGPVSTVATDAILCGRELKLGGRTIEDTVGGNAAVEERMGVAYTECVVKRGMSLTRFVDVTSANAARIFGMYPRKGALAPGSDADIVVFDPSVRRRLAAADLHGADHTVWEGFEVRGWPATTILRGKVIVEEGKLLGDLADGRLIGDRKTAPEVLAGRAG